MDASICLTWNHRELPSYPKAAQPDLSTPEPQRSEAPLSCAAGASLWAIQDLREVALDFQVLQQGQQLTPLPHITNGKDHLKFMRNKWLSPTIFTFSTTYHEPRTFSVKRTMR